MLRAHAKDIDKFSKYFKSYVLVGNLGQFLLRVMMARENLILIIDIVIINTL